jgi:ACT domain-containing protein
MNELSDEDKEIPETIDYYLELVEDMKQIQTLQQATVSDLSMEAPNVEGTLDNYLSMVADYEDILNCFKNCKAIKSRYDSVSLQLNQLNEQLNSYQICPLCGHALNEED